MVDNLTRSTRANWWVWGGINIKLGANLVIMAQVVGEI